MMPLGIGGQAEHAEASNKDRHPERGGRVEGSQKKRIIVAKKKQQKVKPKAYYWIVGLTTVLVLFGLVMITSASQIIAYSKYKDSLYFFKRQFIYALFGTFMFIFFSRIDYRKLRQASWPLAIGCIVLLVMVFIPSVGYRAGGSRSWIPIGFFNLQPSEFAKLGAILLTSYLIDTKRGKELELRDLLPFMVVVFMAGIVILQPDLGTAILILATVFVMLFMGGLPLRYLSGISLGGALFSTGLIILEPYRFMRLISFIDPQKYSKEGGYQIIQSLIAMGSGGLTGVGLAMSKQKFFFLPAAHTDFILAIIGEELGFLGGLAVVIAFILLVVVGFSVAYNAKDSFAKILGIGLISMIALQAIVNVGAVLGLMPITGVPLPLVSFGGSSLVTTMIALGIITSIANNGTKKVVTK